MGETIHTPNGEGHAGDGRHCDEMNDRLARHFGSEKGSAASGGGSMRKTLSVIEISA